MFTEANPDKGTETIVLFFNRGFPSTPFTEANPDKGTETMHLR